MGTLWMEDPRDEAEFAPGHVLFFERNVVHALPTLLEEPVIFLSLASPRRAPEDITFVDPKMALPEPLWPEIMSQHKGPEPKVRWSGW